MEIPPYLFLQVDFDDLQAEIRTLGERIIETLKEAGDSATQSSESWHDNFGHEEAKRQVMQLTGRKASYEKILADARVVDIPKSFEVAQVGHAVFYEDTKTGELKSAVLGSYLSIMGRGISYASPLGSLLYGSTIGNIRSGLIGEITKTIVIKHILQGGVQGTS